MPMLKLQVQLYYPLLYCGKIRINCVALEKQISATSGSSISRPVVNFDAYRNVIFEGDITTIRYDGLHVNESGAA